MQGTVDGLPVDVEWDLYLARSIPDSTDFSAFVTGTWGSPIDVSVDGYLTGNRLRAVIQYVFVNPTTGRPEVPVQQSVEGFLSQQSPFEVFVKNALGQVVGTLTASR